MDVLEKDLRDLGRVRAPEGFAARVLAGAGISARAGDTYAELETPVGVFHVAWNGDGIAALHRAEPGEDFEGWFMRRLGRPVARAAAVPDRLAAQLADVLAGRQRRVRFDLSGVSEFEQEVLSKTLEIPRGEVRTYAWVAREIGRPRAVRAVGTALGHEGVDAGWLEDMAVRGTRFIGSRTTHVFCLPTCRHARRIRPANQVPLRDEQEARREGFRPCSRCRPAAAV